MCDNKEEVMDLRGNGRSWWEGGGFGNDVNTELILFFFFKNKNKGNGGVYPTWTFPPSYKEERNYVICKKMDENGGVWIRKLSES